MLFSFTAAPEQAAAASKIKVDCMTNLALAAQKQRNFSECFRWCEKALRCAPAAKRPLSTLPFAGKARTAQCITDGMCVVP